MKLNKKTKLALVALITAIVIDMWRNWPWVKRICKHFTKAVNTANQKVNGNEAT